MSLSSGETARKIRLRLVLPTILFMLMSSLDRVNVSFAALQMNEELGLGPAEYGFGAGILFAGFLAGQYPSVLLLQRIGMRRWLCGLALVWGVAAGSMAFVTQAWEFYVMRVILGLAEGGLAPGIVLYLSQFATDRERASTFALPMIAIPVSIVIGGPLSGWLMEMDPPLGFSGWRWMFIAESVPTLLLGIAALFYFPNRPDEASWLDADEKAWLSRNAANRAETRRANDWSVLRRPMVWASALVWFCLLSGSYGIMFWLPQMVKQMSTLTPFEIGLVTAAPWAANAVGVYLNSSHSDRTGERFFHIAVPATGAALAIVGASLAGASTVGLLLLTLGGFCLGAAQGAFWALPTRIFTPATFAVGAVAINIAGSSGGAIVPQVVGFARQATGSFQAPTMVIAAILLLAAVVVMVIRGREARMPAPAE